MKSLKSSIKTITYFVVIAVVVTGVSSLGMALSGGVDQQRAVDGGGSLEIGCTCHNPVPDPSVQPMLIGVPGVYGEPLEVGGAYEQRTYNLTVNMTGGPEGPGGFNLHVTDGVLAVAEGEEMAQVLESGDATHLRPTPSRTWNLTWQSPSSPGEAVVFRLTVNAVNGDAVQTPDDKWNRITYISQGAEGALATGGAGGIHVEHLGVNWLAYWVGIASFVFLAVILLVYFFVFKYSETSHTTDHRARKDKK